MEHKYCSILLCILTAFLLCGAALPDEFAVPDFARAAALVDGVRLLEKKENFQLLHDLIPGIRAMKLRPGDLTHEYWLFASEDLEIYGMTVRRKKGSLQKLHSAFKNNPNTIRLRYKKEEFLSALWAKKCTPALHLPREKMLLALLDAEVSVSGAAVLRLKKVPSQALQKLLKKFPELEHLRHLRARMKDAEHKSSLEFAFDNEKSPRKFPFLNWGTALILWQKTGTFRAVYQDTAGKVMSLSLYDPPIGDAARRLVPAAPVIKRRRSSLLNLRQLAAGIHICMLDNGFRLPPDLQTVFDRYVTHPAVYISPYDKKSLPAPRGGKMSADNTSYLYLLKSVPYDTLKDPGTVPMLMEDPGKLPRGRNSLTVAFADGSIRRIRIPGVSSMDPRQAAAEVLKKASGKIASLR